MVRCPSRRRCRRCTLTVIVVDASVVAVALADDGHDGDHVRTRLRGERLAAPELIDLETASVWRRLVRKGFVDGVARRWPDVLANAVSPGWVATRMGGPGAPDDLDQAHRTQAWLAVSDEAAARGSGGYFYHQRPADVHPDARDPQLQERLLDYCGDVSGIALA